MRYPDRGGLSMRTRAARQALRIAAAERFDHGDGVGEIARKLAVTRKSVNEWKRAWRTGGAEALASRGPEVPLVDWTSCSSRPSAALHPQ